MFTYFKQGLALATLSLAFAGHAAELKIECDDSLMGCGLAFTTIPATPALNAYSNITSDPYVITNTGASSVTLTSVVLDVQGDNTVGSGAVTIDGSSTCVASTVLAASDTCNIVLNFEPASAGLLDWDLIVTPQSTQRPLALDIKTVVTQPSAYVLNKGYSVPGTVSLCPIGSDGSFGSGSTSSSDCTVYDLGESGAGTAFAPWDIVLNPAGTFAYISNNATNAGGINIRICPVNPDKTLDNASCYDATQVFTSPSGLAFNENGSQLYVTTSTGAGTPTNNLVYRCPVEAVTGDLLNSCVLVVSSLDNPNSIAFDADFSHAYVADGPGVAIYTVDGSGDFSYLETFTDSNIAYVLSIAPNAANSQLYLLDFINKTALNCPLTADMPGACNVNSVGNLLVSPAGITVTDAYAYIADMSYGVGVDSTVAFCGIDVDGSLNACVQLKDSSFMHPAAVWISP